ncbi:SH3 domain-containing protein [Pontibacillus salicampi]|uniref:SH3 domain-containing protein n=1 Tax=Pontibacillus salicampi TaxID=1449801 RepID=A0ABV6LJC0_9BACI
MHQQLRVLLFILMLFTTFTATTGSSVSAEGQVEVNAEPLQVREGPGLSYKAIGEVHKQESYTILSQENDWIKIQADSDTTGWVASWHVSITEDSSSTITSNADELRVRSEASSSSSVIGALQEGEEAPLLQQKEDWVQISYKGETGYVYKNYISITSSSPQSSTIINANHLNVREEPSTSSSVLDQLNKGMSVEILEKKNTWTKIAYQQKQGWVANEFLIANANASNKTNQSGTITVETPVLHVRAKPNVQSDLIGKVKEGTSLSFSKEEDGWYYITLSNGTSGWIASWLVSQKGETAKQEDWITFLYNATNIREGPSTDTSIVGRGGTGDQFKVLNHEDNWYEIEYNGHSAYVADWIVSPSDGYINEPSSPGLRNKTIVIDPGHGGRDVGAIGASGIFEKEVVLSTAKHLENRLKMAGANVIMTRSTDSYVALSSRAATSNIQDADAFLSLHYNSFPEAPSANGIGTFYYDSHHRELAKTVQAAMVKATGLDDRKAKQEDFHVIRENRQPSLLLELGFLSNKQEETYVRTNDYQENVSKGITTGLMEYFSK